MQRDSRRQKRLGLPFEQSTAMAINAVFLALEQMSLAIGQETYRILQPSPLNRGRPVFANQAAVETLLLKVSKYRYLSTEIAQLGLILRTTEEPRFYSCGGVEAWAVGRLEAIRALQPAQRRVEDPRGEVSNEIANIGALSFTNSFCRTLRNLNRSAVPLQIPYSELLVERFNVARLAIFEHLGTLQEVSYEINRTPPLPEPTEI